MSNYQNAIRLTLDVPADSPLGDAIADEHDDPTGEVRVDVRSARDFVIGEALVTEVDDA